MADSNDGTIQFDVETDSTSVVNDVTSLVASLEKAFARAQELRNEFFLMASSSRDNAAAQQDVLKAITEMRNQTAATQRAQQSILNTGSPNGGTLRDDQLRNFQLNAVTTAINTSVEQVQARVAEAGAKAAERLIRSTGEAISARLTKLDLQTNSEVANFGSADYVQALVNRNKIAAQRLVRNYAGIGSLDDQEAAREAEKNESYLNRVRNNSLRLEIRRRDAEQREQERAEDRSRRDQERREYAASPEARGEQFENRLRIFGDYATIGLSVAAIRSMLVSIVDLEDEFKKFQAITQTTDTEMLSFRDTLLKVGEASRYSLRDLTQTATALGQTGLDADAVAKTLPAIINLATASGSSLKEATDVVTAAMGAYNLQATQAVDIADAMTAALNRTKLNMTQLAQGISVSANIARDANVGLNELVASIASLAQAGVRSGSTIGTGLRQLIQELEAPSDKLKQTLNALGISLQDVDIKSNGLIGVLENLRDKGFGTSEALKALDLRAAAAFSALTGRLDRVKQLQEALLLTSASSDGAAKAGESLSATWQRTLNVATELAVKGFDPVIGALKSLVSITGSALSVLNNLGGLLPVLSAGFAAAAGAFLVSQASQVTLGLLSLAPAALTATTALTGLSSALAFLAANPLLIGGVIAGGIILSALFGGEGKLEEKIDKINAVLNGLQSRQQQIETTIGGLDRGIDTLITKREKLNEDPLLRRVTIIETQKQFEGLSGMVSASANKIDDLIEAMRRLRAEMAQQLPGNFAAQLLELDKRISTKQQQLTETNSGVFGNVRERLGFDSLGIEGLNRWKLRQSAGPGFDSLFDFLAPGGEGQDPAAAREAGGSLQLALLRRRNELTAKKDLGQNVDEALKTLDVLSEVLNEKLKRINDIRADVLTREQTERNLKVADIQATPGFQALLERRDAATNDLRRGLESINGSTTLSANEKESRFLSLRDRLRQEIVGIDEDLKTFAKSQELAGQSPENVKEALAKLSQDLEGIRKGTAAGLDDAHRAIVTLNLQRNSKATQAEISAATSALTEQSSTADVDLTQSLVQNLIEKQRNIQIALIQAKSANPDRLSTEEQEAINAANTEFDAKQAELVQQMNERRKKIVDRILANEQGVLRAREAQITGEISSLEKEIARSGTTAEKAAELRRKIDELIKQASDLIDKQRDVQIQRDIRNLPRDYSSNGSANGTVKSIIDAAQGAGQSSLLRYLLGLGNAESGFNPNATNGRARGLFQFMPDTWAENGGGDVSSVADQVRNVLRLIERDLNSFRTRMGRGADDSELYVMHQQGRDGGLALMDPRNANRLARDVLGPFYDDPEKARRAITGNGGREDMTASEFVAVIRRYFEGKAGAADRYLTSTDQAARDKAVAEADRDRQALRDRSRAAGDAVDRKQFDERMLRDNAANRADEQSIKAAELLLKRTVDSPDAERVAVGITGSIAGLMKRAVDDYLANPKNAEKSKSQQADDIAAIRQPFIERIQREALTTSDTIAKRVVDQQQRIVNDLKLQAEEMDRNPGKFTQGQIAQNDQRLKQAERTLEVETQIASKRTEANLLDRQIAAIKGSGVADEEQLTNLKERQAQLEKEIANLERRRVIQQNADQSDSGIGKAISAGSYSYFKSAGMLNARGEFKSFTEEFTGLWTQSLSSAEGGLSRFFTDLSSRTKKAGDAFRDMARSIIQSMQQIVSKALSQSILRAIFGNSVGGSDFSVEAPGLLFGGGSPTGFALGGPVRHADGGGFAASNRDSVHAYLTPDEYVLRGSAARAIGRKNLDALNSLGNSRVSVPQSPVADKPQSNFRSETHVWVVSPDQVPPPSEKDIIATVARDIQNKGTMRTLIRSVINGNG